MTILAVPRALCAWPAMKSRVTDAAMGGRAECVMLNKGPSIVEAVRVLADILGRMAAHQDKKRSLLRRLRSFEGQP